MDNLEFCFVWVSLLCVCAFLPLRLSSTSTERRTVTNYKAGRHIFYTAQRKMIVINCYYARLPRRHPSLFAVALGTLAKCQTDALKFITTGRFVTRGHRWYTCALCPAEDFKPEASSTTRDSCCSDLLGTLFFFFL